MKKLFSIGDTAKLNAISVKTLRYYDDIGLLKPRTTNKQTGYRYYSYDQFFLIEMIQFAKELGYSLKQIQTMLNTQDTEEIMGNLISQRQKARQELERLKENIETLDKQIAYVDYSRRHVGRKGVYTAYFPEKHVMASPSYAGVDFQEMDLQLKKILLRQKRDIKLSTQFGYLLNPAALYLGKAELMAAFMGVERPDLVRKADQEHVTAIPAGKYYCYQCKILQGEEVSPDFARLIARLSPSIVYAEELFSSFSVWESNYYELRVLEESSRF